MINPRAFPSPSTLGLNVLLTTIGADGPMPSLTLSGQLIWFSHCPKTGGTSVEQFMVARWGDAVGHLHWGWDTWWRQGGWRLADPPNSPQHLVWEDAVKHLPDRPDVVFAVVRDPVARLASEYRWQRRGRRGTFLGRLLAFLPFSLWLELMLATAAKHPYVFDNHLRPQSDFVPDGARVFHLEDGLHRAVRWLMETVGEPITEEALPHALPSGTKPRIPAQSQSLIARYFAVDYARFGYRSPPLCHDRSGLGRLIVAALVPPIVFLYERGRL